MAITYENVIFDRIIDNLHSLVADEFSIPIVFDESQERGNQSYLITPTSDSLIELLANGQARDYEIQINYELKLSGNYTKNSYKQLSEISERMKRLIHNNTSYSSSGTYIWHDARISTIEFSRSSDDFSVSNVNMQFNCTSTEVL